MARLSIAQWALVRDDYENMGLSFNQLGDKYNVSHTSVSRRAKSENWKVNVSTSNAQGKIKTHKTTKTTNSKGTTSNAQSNAQDKDQTHNQTHNQNPNAQPNAQPENPESVENINEEVEQTFISRDTHVREDKRTTVTVNDLDDSDSSFVPSDEELPFLDYDPIKDLNVKSALNAIDSELSALAYAYGGSPTSTSKYHPAFARVAYRVALLGSTQKDLADILGVNESTITVWLGKYREFAIAWRGGAAYTDSRVATSLLQSALGYNKELIEERLVGGEIKSITKEVHVEPNVHAQIFWLKNRQPNNWREKIEIKEDIKPAVIDHDEADARYNRILENAAELERKMNGRAERLNLVLDGDVSEGEDLG